MNSETKLEEMFHSIMIHNPHGFENLAEVSIPKEQAQLIESMFAEYTLDEYENFSERNLMVGISDQTRLCFLIVLIYSCFSDFLV